MNCTVDKLIEQIPSVAQAYSNNTIDLMKLPLELREEVSTWLLGMNNTAIFAGFEKPLFSLQKREVSERIATHLIVENINNINEFSDYLENTVKPDMLMDKALDQERELNTNLVEDIMQESEVEVEVVDENVYQEDMFNLPHNPLFSPVVQNKNVFTPTFKEWKKEREDLIERLKKSQERQFRLKEDSTVTNKLIVELEKELANFKTNDPTLAYESVMNEIVALDSLLELVVSPNSTAANSARILEANLVRSRLTDLYNFFHVESSGGEIFIQFHEGLDEEGLNKLISQTSALKDKYDTYLSDILFNLVMESDAVKENTKILESEGKQKDIALFQNRIAELLDPSLIDPRNSPDGDKYVAQNTLGAYSYDSLLAEIVILTRDANKAKEIGITANWKKALETAYDKIKNVKFNGPNGQEYFLDALLEKDDYGVKMNTLIDYIGLEYRSSYKNLGIARKAYFKVKGHHKIKKYESWMEGLKDRSDFIQLHKTRAFTEAHRNTPEFKDFLKSTDAEIDAYEAEIKAKIGEIAFEIELQKQTDKANSFLINTFSDPRTKNNQNPLAFLEHFYSDKYKSFDSRGQFLMPFYLSDMPNMSKDGYYNQEFLDIEAMGVEGFKDFYINAKHLLDYTRDSSLSERNYMAVNEIINMEDTLGREAMKDLSFTGKIGANLKELFRGGLSEFRNVNLENPSQSNEYRRQFKNHFTDYGRQQAKEMTRILKEQSMDYLVALGEKNGLNIIEEYKEDTVANRSFLVDSIVRDTINRSSSLDLFQRITHGAGVAESVNTRRSVEGVLALVKDYVKQNNLSNVGKYLENWEANNVLQVGYIDNPGFKAVSAMERQKVFGLRSYNSADDALKKFYEEEKKNLKGEYNFTFYNEGSQYDYKTVNGTHYRSEAGSPRVQVTLSEIEEAYGEYIDGKIKSIGKPIQVANILNGLAWNMYKAYLWAAPASGIKNRFAGFNQNNQRGASGLHGYDLNDLTVARKALLFVNTRKYSSKAIKSLNKQKKAQQIDILDYLAFSLNLIDNVAEEVLSGDGGTKGTVKSRVTKFKDFMGDFAMNNPEYHNQMEILLAMMQKVNITKVDGTVEPLFNPKTMEFPFDPVTMKLKPEYATEANIANWENFKPDTEGNAPQNTLITRYKINKNKSQGNYVQDDKIAMQSTMTGRASISFIKWMFENADAQFGSKKVSIAEMKIGVEGRKRAMLSVAPVLTTHLALQGVNYFSIGATAAGLLSGVAALSIPVVGVLTASSIGYLIYQNKKNLKASKHDLKLSIDYTKESIARILSTTTSFWSRGRIRLSEEQIQKFSNNHEQGAAARGITLEERRYLSESSQEIGDKFNMYISFSLAAVALKALHALVYANLSEEDKERKLTDLEGYFKFLMNMRNSMTSEMQKWSNPLMFKDDFDHLILVKFVQDNWSKLQNAEERYEDGKTSASQSAWDASMAAGELVFGLPRNVVNVINPHKRMFFDARIYNGEDSFDKALLSQHLSEEGKYKRLVTIEKNKARYEIQDIYRKKLREKLESEGKPLHRLEDMVKKHTSNRFKDAGTNAGKKSYKQIMESTDWKKLVKDTEDKNVSTNVLKKRSKK